MSLDNLLSGVVGGVVGGALGLVGAVLVIWAESKRYRRESEGAAQLVLTEVLLNIGNLDDVAKTLSAASVKLLSVSIWEAERVRLAALLNAGGQMTVTTAFQAVVYVSRIAQELDGWNPGGADTWVQSEAGRNGVSRALVMMRKASDVLMAAAPFPGQDIAEWEREVQRVKQKLDKARSPAP